MRVGLLPTFCVQNRPKFGWCAFVRVSLVVVIQGNNLVGSKTLENTRVIKKEEQQNLNECSDKNLNILLESEKWQYRNQTTKFRWEKHQSRKYQVPCKSFKYNKIRYKFQSHKNSCQSPNHQIIQLVSSYDPFQPNKWNPPSTHDSPIFSNPISCLDEIYPHC